MRKRIDIKPGAKFGKWTVVREAGTDKFQQRVVLCRCECGVERELARRRLISGDAKSCSSCTQRKYYVSPGDMYGKLTVIREDRTNKNYVHMVLCRCKCGAEYKVNKFNLMAGTTKSCIQCHYADLGTKYTFFGRTFTTRQLADLTGLTWQGIRAARYRGSLTEAYILKAIGKKVKRQVGETK